MLGDVVGPDALEAVRRNLYRIKKEYNVDFTVINGENANIGNGISPDDAETLFSAGADVITGGNHTMHARGVARMLEERPENIIRSILDSVNMPVLRQ